MPPETVDYGFRCTSCSSPIRIGHVQCPESIAGFTLNRTEIRCGSCHASDIYEGKATVFPRSGVFAYWGVRCVCGNFQPVKKALVDPLEEPPDVTTFKTICSHRGGSTSSLDELVWVRAQLIKIERDEEIQNFRPHRLFQ
jgi:hypothetical protein